ncbi:MAG TPA: hypothetical protein VFQ44_02650 [Streptosporangiaceae bacterium]|nr:hypothetical protein [Streptosporangiaceae bacterium]
MPGERPSSRRPGLGRPGPEPGQAKYARADRVRRPRSRGRRHGRADALVTSITSWQAAPAPALAAACHERWAHEAGNAQLKTHLRGPGPDPAPGQPALVEQELWGYLLAHLAISALICTAATNAGIDPDRVKFRRTLRIVRRAIGPAIHLGQAVPVGHPAVTLAAAGCPTGTGQRTEIHVDLEGGMRRRCVQGDRPGQLSCWYLYGWRGESGLGDDWLPGRRRMGAGIGL